MEKERATETNRNNFPDLSNLLPGEQVHRIFLSLSNELSTPKILACPADTRRPAENWQEFTTNNISYFLGIGAQQSNPESMLADDRNLTINGQRLVGRVELSTNIATAAWDTTMHQKQGNAVMGDGSVQLLSSARLQGQLKSSGSVTNIFIFP